MSNPLSTQIGGTHYKMWEVQPVEVYFKYDLNAFEANILKYGSRFLFKNGAEDLDKMLHYAELYADFILREVEARGIKAGTTERYGLPISYEWGDNLGAFEYFIRGNDLRNISPATARILEVAAQFLASPSNLNYLNELATEARLLALEIYGR